ncbi:MAG: glycosyltransferase family 8 protein [Lachnospiraceae bacterium]|nr:glycosyltransferase family 8 protein [Lachnospiraceae bacterium]
MNPGVAHIVYAADDRFAEILGVSLISLYENSKDMDEIVIYVFDNNISENNKRKVEGICKKYGRKKIKWFLQKNINEELSIHVRADRGSISQFSRLFISSIIPDDLDRILYLDCDVIVNKSIRELWNMNLQGKTIGALSDAFSPLYRKNIDLKRNDIMFNSGVMLIDLLLWKKNRIQDEIIKFIEKKKGMVQQGDQGVLNAVLSHQTYCFEPRFNSVTIFFDFNFEEMLIYRKPPIGFYKMTEIVRAIEDPYVIHYTTSFISKRPWVEGCDHKYVDKWLFYKNKSPWKTQSLWMDDSGIIKRIVIGALKALPRSIMVRICGFMQAYVRPLYYRMLEKVI